MLDADQPASAPAGRLLPRPEPFGKHVAHSPRHAGDRDSRMPREDPSCIAAAQTGTPCAPSRAAVQRLFETVVEEELRPRLGSPWNEGARDSSVTGTMFSRSSSATATAASPSPRPVKPRPSVVVARTVTRPGLDAERLREPRPHRSAERRDPRLLADEHAVRVHELPAGLAHLRVGAREQVERRGALPLGRARGEERADVAESRRAEERVDQRVRDHVAVRVARRARAGTRPRRRRARAARPRRARARRRRRRLLIRAAPAGARAARRP